MLDRKLLQLSLQRGITEEEEYSISIWEKGRELEAIRHTRGFEVALEMLQSYAIKALADIAKIDPTHKEEVLAQQAVAYALDQFYNKFVSDVGETIIKSKLPPEVVSQEVMRKTMLPNEVT